MIVLASIFVFARVGIQAWQRKAMEAQDYLIYFAFIFFVGMTICYLAIIPKIYMIGKVTEGLRAPWETMQADVVLYIRMMFVTSTLFWFSLWSVKLSLLALYRKLMEGLPRVYLRLWWAVFIFCLVSLVGCVVSYVVSCPDFSATLSRGECSGPRSFRGQQASLYMSYGVDTLSDFMIMFLPIRLVWNLQMPRGQKMAVVALFASGFVCIAFATLRVVQIGMRTGKHSAPSPTWLALWSIIETAIAIGIGCCPALAVLYRISHTQHVPYDSHGYVRHNQSQPGSNRKGGDAINMNTLTVGTARSKASRNDPYWDDAAGSQEELAVDTKRIRVTTIVQQDTRQSSISPSKISRDEARSHII
ncbi:uncharacterized protein K460DRAFT_426592 [Cucurbitaria berberidis CBS 394.84]|uniref:Rhodopsin domain-containing protein n=1 Tax=Cucurbitaria berberidis CBS 394.84 TaxID=1168544 RepID=A0A9P4GK51_9PLEO|nr:uncharacterized protein K460DRAFT_426592 [Cucurbitaria berberidis CBS 394.84]KAF1847783.1 hypothetical protein K460DRAFT_426592 [Cucurbitaria berberidis CBS 394.84]